MDWIADAAEEQEQEQESFSSFSSFSDDKNTQLEMLDSEVNLLMSSLDSLDLDAFPLSTKERHMWRLAQLEAYRETYGHADVPFNWQRNPKLGRWLAMQRYKSLKGSLSPAAVEELLDAGAPIAPPRYLGDGLDDSESLDDVFAVFLAHAVADAEVSLDNDNFALVAPPTSLGAALHAQLPAGSLRRWLVDTSKRWVDGELSSDFEHKLAYILGVPDTAFSLARVLKTFIEEEAQVFDPPPPHPPHPPAPSTPAEKRRGPKDHFYRRVEALRAFREHHGHLNIRDRDDAKLARWMRRMRTQRRDGALSDKRVAALDEVGFDWNVRANGRPRMYVAQPKPL